MLYFVVVLLLTFDLFTIPYKPVFTHKVSFTIALALLVIYTQVEELYHTMYYLTHQENSSMYFNKVYLCILAI